MSETSIPPMALKDALAHVRAYMKIIRAFQRVEEVLNVAEAFERDEQNRTRQRAEFDAAMVKIRQQTERECEAKIQNADDYVRARKTEGDELARLNADERATLDALRQQVANLRREVEKQDALIAKRLEAERVLG